MYYKRDSMSSSRINFLEWKKAKNLTVMHVNRPEKQAISCLSGTIKNVPECTQMLVSIPQGTFR